MNYCSPRTYFNLSFEQISSGFTQYAFENNTTLDYTQCPSGISELGSVQSTDNVLEECTPNDDVSRITVAGDQWILKCQGDSDPYLATIQNVEAGSISCPPGSIPLKLAYVTDKPFPQHCIITSLIPLQDCWANLDVCTESDQPACD